MRSTWLDRDRVRTVELVRLSEGRYRVTVDQGSFEVAVEFLGDGRLRLVTDHGAIGAAVTAVEGRRFVRLGHADFAVERVSDARAARRGRAQEGRLESPMPGLVTKVLVAKGDRVRKGQALIAVEAMKMEHMLRAPRDGRVIEINAGAGEMVNAGVPLVEMDQETS